MPLRRQNAGDESSMFTRSAMGHCAHPADFTCDLMDILTGEIGMVFGHWSINQPNHNLRSARSKFHQLVQPD
jgi:hypothetical protein